MAAEIGVFPVSNSSPDATTSTTFSEAVAMLTERWFHWSRTEFELPAVQAPKSILKQFTVSAASFGDTNPGSVMRVPNGFQVPSRTSC